METASESENRCSRLRRNFNLKIGEGDADRDSSGESVPGTDLESDRGSGDVPSYTRSLNRAGVLLDRPLLLGVIGGTLR